MRDALGFSCSGLPVGSLRRWGRQGHPGKELEQEVQQAIEEGGELRPDRREHEGEEEENEEERDEVAHRLLGLNVVSPKIWRKASSASSFPSAAPIRHHRTRVTEGKASIPLSKIHCDYSKEVVHSQGAGCQDF